MKYITGIKSNYSNSMLKTVVYLLISVLFIGCATSQNSSLVFESFEEDFKNGNLRLTCGTPCTTPWVFSRSDNRDFYDAGLWKDLATNVYRVGFELDQTYYYLGVSAENLGYLDAASTYYKLSKISFKCRGRLYNNCDGLVFPDDLEIAMARLPNSSGLESYSFQEIQLGFPLTGWRMLSEDSQSVNFIRNYPNGVANHLAVYPVDVFPVARGRSREQHIEGYFDYERTKERPSAIIWSGFEEGVREIGGTNYPVMSFRVRDERDISRIVQIEGLFFIIFTKDLQQRHRFYGFMWQEIHPLGIPGAGSTELEEIVKAISIGHFQPPPA